MLSAAVFGSGAIWDAFVLAFTIPNLFRRIFGEGALTSALLPVLVEVRTNEGKERASEVASSVATLVGLLLLVVALITSGSALFYKFNADSTSGLIPLLIAIMIFYLPLICTSAIMAASLNADKHFAVPAFTPVLLNLVWIAVMLAVIPLQLSLTVKALILAGGIIIGGVLQLGIQIPVLRRRGYRISFRPVLADPQVKQVFANMLPVVIALLVTQINVLVDRVLAQTMITGDGAVSALFYGNRLMQFPLALFGIAVGVAVFPSLREFALGTDRSPVWATVNQGFSLLLFLMLPCAIGLISIGQPLIDLLFNRGEFANSAGAAERTFYVLAAYSAGLLFFSLNILLTKTYHALDERKFPARIAVLMVVVNLILNIVFLKTTPLREAGLALSTTICALLNSMILLVHLVRRHGFDAFNNLLISLIRSMISATVMGFAVVAVTGIGRLQLIAWPQSTFGTALAVGCGVVSGVVVYTGLAYLFRSPEPARLLALLRRKKR